MENLKGIIFDFNGTLLWDSAYHNAAWNLFLKKYGISLSDKEIHDNMHGKTNGEIFSYLFKREISGEELFTLAEEKESIYRGLIMKDNFQLADGAARLFNVCLGASVPISIATSSDRENAEFYFKRYRLDRWFMKLRFVFNDYTLKGKPAPDIFNRTAERMFLKPDEIIVFEDSPAGIEAAERFGAGKIVIVNSSNADYSKYSHQVISSLNEAVDIVDDLIIKKRIVC